MYVEPYILKMSTQRRFIPVISRAYKKDIHVQYKSFYIDLM